jgi:hypothetical protein
MEHSNFIGIDDFGPSATGHRIRLECREPNATDMIDELDFCRYKLRIVVKPPKKYLYTYRPMARTERVIASGGPWRSCAIVSRSVTDHREPHSTACPTTPTSFSRGSLGTETRSTAVGKLYAFRLVYANR